jgi:UDP-N-acetylmuramate: L-alanyl-gamma-D-glutamyl-meso-diaminopimelate ligase
VTPTPAGTSFRVQHGGTSLGTFESPMVGAHNVRNALAAMAVATDVGLQPDVIREGLRAFAGVKRRLEAVGTVAGVTVFDDFAHHPTAVRETLAAMRAAHPDDRIWAVFEPRSASSCRRVFQQAFAESFAAADEVVIAGVFRSSLPEEQRLSTDQLVAELTAAGVHARSIPSVDAIVGTIAAEARAGDHVVIMSNGGFGGIHAKLIGALRR